MTGKVSNLATRVYLDQFDFSGFLNKSDLGVKVGLPDVACFSDTGPRRVEDNYDHSHSLAGFFDGADDQIDEQVFAVIAAGADHHLCQLFGANTEGSVAYESVVRLSDQPRSAQIGQAIALAFNAQGSNGIVRGNVLRSATISGTGNGTGFNQGATVAGQIYAVTFRAISGTFTSVGLKIQESTDDAAGDPYADVAGLSATLTQAGATRVTTTAATEAWKRLVVSSFVGTSVVILVTGGVVAGSA